MEIIRKLIVIEFESNIIADINRDIEELKRVE